MPMSGFIGAAALSISITSRVMPGSGSLERGGSAKGQSRGGANASTSFTSAEAASSATEASGGVDSVGQPSSVVEARSVRESARFMVRSVEPIPCHSKCRVHREVKEPAENLRSELHILKRAENEAARRHSSPLHCAHRQSARWRPSPRRCSACRESRHPWHGPEDARCCSSRTRSP